MDANQLLQRLATEIQRRLNDAGAEVAHLKMTLEPDSGLGDLGIANLVQNDFVPELSQSLLDPFESGQLTLNLRAEGTPAVLREAVSASVEACLGLYPELTATWEHLECFKPGKPAPTHRMSANS